MPCPLVRWFAGSLAVVLVWTAAAGADSVVLDFAGVSWPTFAGKTSTDIEDAILSYVAADYSEYSWLSISKGTPVATDTVVEFGQAAGAGSFGNAHIVDWDNKLTAHNNIIATNDAPGSSIDVFVSGFVASGSPYTDTFDRFTTALGGTASHELGHGLGLRHFDTFGPSTVGGNPNPQADQHIMATGSTGLAGTDRTDYDRVFSEHSRDKLHYLDPANQPSRTRSELSPAPAAHATLATAEPLTIGPADYIGAVGREIMVKEASIAVPGEADIYSFAATAGDRIYANIFSTRLTDSSGLAPLATSIDLVLALFKPDMTLIYTNDDTGYNATSGADPGIGDTEIDFYDGMTKESLQLIDELTWGAQDGSLGDGVFIPRTLDPILIDSPTGDYFTLTDTGTWYIGIAGFSADDVGDYELFVSIERVPEPATIVLLAIGLLGLIGFGRRYRSSKP